MEKSEAVLGGNAGEENCLQEGELTHRGEIKVFDNIIAVDQGFSYCKVLTGGKLSKFPTAIARVREAGITWTPSGEEIYEFNGLKYRVGEAALDCDAKAYERDVDFLLKYTPLLVAHALKTATHLANRPTTLIVGLPLAQFIARRGELAASLARFEVNSEVYEFDVQVHAQGIGALFDHGCKAPRGEGGYLIDIGFNTAIALRYQRLSFQRDGSKQYDQWGLSRFLEELLNVLANKYGRRDLDFIAANNAFLTGHLEGSDVDIREIAAPLLGNYLEDLFEMIRNDHRRYFGACQRIIISGGGAHYCRAKGLIPREYTNKIVFTEQSEFANVRGFYSMGKPKNADTSNNN